MEDRVNNKEKAAKQAFCKDIRNLIVLLSKYNPNEFHLVLNEYECSFGYLKFGTRQMTSTESREGTASIHFELILTFL